MATDVQTAYAMRKTFGKGRKVTPTTKTVLEQSGVVQLVKLERFDCPKEIYGVTFPQKVGTVDGGPICEQFMSYDEAVRAYRRYVEFFSKPKPTPHR